MKQPGEKEILEGIWQAPPRLKQGAWLWWFWLFFIHDENTAKTGKCRQIMILWSVKNDRKIKCNHLDIEIPVQIEKLDGGRIRLNGAAAAWYFDGRIMHDNFVLETSKMELDPHARKLSAPGATPSEFYVDGEEYVTRISSGTRVFELRAKKTDPHPAIGPNFGTTSLPFGFGVEGTRLEVMELTGFEENEEERMKLRGTAYFQKILLSAPPPQWYWGIYHFSDGSYFTYMQTYAGRAMLADNLLGKAELKTPTAPLTSDIYFYHKPTGRLFKGHALSVAPEKLEGGLWRHVLEGSGKDFEMSAMAESYSHSCWTFEKNAGPLPLKSKFKYNEYPAVLKRLEIRVKNGETIALENGVGNMENSWGFLI